MGKVKLKDQLGRVINLNDDATKGATVGRDLYGPDGKLLKASDIINPTQANPNAVATVWKLIREIPENIRKVAALTGTGLAARLASGDWALRTLQPGTGIAVTNGDGDAGDPSVALTPAALASLALADSAVQEVRPGTNVTIDNTDPRRPIVNATGSSGSGFVPFFIPNGQQFVVPEYQQALFSLPIEIGDGASIELDGALEEVS